jgi:hypothetical protein
MDAPDRAKQEPGGISIARCRELLGDDADTMSDEEVLIVARHAESLAHVVIFASTSGRGEATHLAGVRCWR